ncbi:cytochrome c oxidase assembly protein [Kineobactrum sediminis]|uniref:Cytochrome c oxidase assembly protein CtaG n=1 Tax=Kineobactrum sediminis TaxID=1905677 RepID=A0A2N5Y7P5_9GAMM|nr:cytochrome c oxidase assembly protein [Kineobactrum sediminis]PLW84387.1 cytochrome c oxidase assembly protein [Kineobactrum sediminis]
MLRLNNNPVLDTVIKLVTTAVAMFAFVFVVMVPLYDVLCDALGINGKTSGEAYTAVQAGVDESRTITIQFVATNNESMPWEFGPSVTMMKVNPGASNDTVFLARNPLPQAMIAQAIPSVSPARAAAYFHKTECFCFNQQPLDGETATDMPLQFIVDRDLPQDIKTITLSYTLFDITDLVDGDVAAR